ncbi:MAG TPA: hypothetical protein VLX64_05335 [Thermoplasmata archaeon]|nr:hypothetical protein [Thermoplasmata archaeon]
MPPARPTPVRRGLLVAVEGPSAVGKTTVVRRVASGGWAETLPEAYDRLRPALSLDFRSPEELRRLERRLFAEETRRSREARRARARGARVLVDTGFAGPLTYTASLDERADPGGAVLRDLLRSARTAARGGRWGLPDLVIVLTAPARLLDARTQRDPVGHPRSLAGRHRRVGIREVAFWRAVARSLPAPRVLFVSATGDARGVAARVRAAIDGVGDLRPSGPRAAARFLAVLRRWHRGSRR